MLSCVTRLIYGFIAKDETIKKLSGKEPGTFMLRFSESDIENSNKADICGCLTLAVYERDPHAGARAVCGYLTVISVVM